MAAPDSEGGSRQISPVEGGRVTPSTESFRKRFLIGLAVVILIEFVVVPLFFLVVPSAKEGENFLAILPMEIAGFVHSFASSNSVDYTFVDVDRDAFANWGKSGHTDRRRIKELISRIASDKYNKPKAIVVDIDLSAAIVDESAIDGQASPQLQRCPEDGSRYPSGDEETSNFTQEQILTFYICEYAKNSDNPPLIFVQSLRKRPKSSEKAALAAVPLLFQKPINDGPIYFAASGFLRSADGKVRSWRLAEPACVTRANGEEELTTIPSVELLVLPIRVRDQDPPEGALHPDIVSKRVQNAYAGSCYSVGINVPVAPIRLGDYEIQLSPKRLQDRIIYTINWRSEQAANRLTGHAHYITAEKVEKLRGTDVDDFFSNRIVIIGGSNEESRDIYNTPYGPMPGALILINAIDSLRVNHQIKETSYLAEKAVSIAIAIIVMLILEFLFRIEMSPIVYMMGYGIGLVASIALLYGRIWFGVSGVIAGGVAHPIAKGALEIWDDMKKEPNHKLRVLLASRLRHGRDGDNSE
jgi:CHASE2 domain